MVSIAFILGVIIGGCSIWFINNKFGNKPKVLLVNDSHNTMDNSSCENLIEPETTSNEEDDLKGLVLQFYSEQTDKLKELAELAAEKDLERIDDRKKNEIIEYDEAKFN